jgi:hypothetical protein
MSFTVSVEKIKYMLAPCILSCSLHDLAASKLFDNMSWGNFFLSHSFFTVQLNGRELYGDAYIFL